MNRSLFVTILALVLMGCEPGGDDGGRIESRTVLSNSDLENHIRAKLDSDEHLKAANLSVIADAKKKKRCCLERWSRKRYGAKPSSLPRARIPTSR